ncbi:MAG: ribonuclease D [Spirulina sp. SIO3F2]|nr:ribonuclease D [Spirulina sp. SIO3F2]
MPYLRDPDELAAAIAQLSQAPQLWLDTETADYKTKKPRLSLIQVLAVGEIVTPEQVWVLDVLEQPKSVEQFIDIIMENGAIAKICHNAAFDRRFLGKDRVQNLTCTLEMAKAIPHHLLPVENHQLKTLTEYFAIASAVDKAEQSSDWGQRPLTPSQCHYASLDVIYLAQIYNHLRPLYQRSHPEPATEDIEALILRYHQLKPKWDTLNAEVKHIEERLKKAMPAQGIQEQQGVSIQTSKRTTRKVDFGAIAAYAQAQDLDLNFAVNLTKDTMKKLGNGATELPIEEQVSTIIKLKTQPLAEEDLLF